MVLSYAPDPDNSYEDREVEGNFLKSTIKVENIHYGYRLINSDACYLGHLRSAGASELIPCKNSVKDVC